MGCPEHDFGIFTKCLSVCDTDLLAMPARKLMDGIRWNFIFSCILTKTGAEYILVPIAQEVPLFEFFRFL